MELEKDQEKKSSYSAAAISDSSPSGISLSPPELDFALQNEQKDTSKTEESEERDWKADYERLKEDDIDPVYKGKIMSAGGFKNQSQGDYEVFYKSGTRIPAFIGLLTPKDSLFEPYNAGYRSEVYKSKGPSAHRKYMEITDVKMKVSSEDGFLSVDSGGSVGINGKKMGFEANYYTGDFSISSDLIPIGEISGNIWQFPTFNLSAGLKAQLGPITINNDFSFEVEISIPGLPNSPSLVISGRIFRNAIAEDFNKAIAYDIFPFIGEITDALPDGI